MKLNLVVEPHHEVTVVWCRGRIAYREEAAILSRTVNRLLGHSRHVILELSGVEMVDSAGLGELVLMLMQAQANRSTLKLAGPRKHVRQLLELTNLVSVLEVHPTVDDAVLASRGLLA